MTNLEKQLYNDSLGLQGRGEALRHGKKTYIGKQCENGHGGVRYASDARCTECTAIRNHKKNSTNNSKKVKYVKRHLIDDILQQRILQKELDDMYL